MDDLGRALNEQTGGNGFFSFLYLKKTKFQKYMLNREIFKNGCLTPP